MRFLHTSDWHIGRTVRGRPRLDEQEAALQQVLSHAREQAVDCLLVAGDVFDSSTPAPEAERLVFWLFSELYGAGIPAVVIAGNHDHPRRLDALRPLVETLRIHVRGKPVGVSEGALVEVESRDGRERALVAALPWVHERDAVDFDRLQLEPSAPLMQYAERVAMVLSSLTREFRPDTVNVALAHLLVDQAVVGQGGGERELHMSMGIYGVSSQRLPTAAQYIALGHVHKAQKLAAAVPAWYSGSLLQLDFGEREQQKFANLVEVHAGQPAQVEQLPITAGRQLIDVGLPAKGVLLTDLPSYAASVGDAWLRVYVEVDGPVANLPQTVRETLPNAVTVERARGSGLSEAPEGEQERLGPVEMFERFYASKLGRDREAPAQTLSLFRKLLEEESVEAAEA